MVDAVHKVQIARDNEGYYTVRDPKGNVRKLNQSWGVAMDIFRSDKLWGDAAWEQVSYQTFLAGERSSLGIRAPVDLNATAALLLRQKGNFAQHLRQEVRDLALNSRVVPGYGADRANRFLESHGHTLKKTGSAVTAIDAQLTAIEKWAKQSRRRLPNDAARQRFDSALTEYRATLLRGAKVIDEAKSLAAPEVLKKSLVPNALSLSAPDLDALSAVRDGTFRATIQLPKGKYERFEVKGTAGSRATLYLRVVNGKIDWINAKVSFDPPLTKLWVKVRGLGVKDRGDGPRLISDLKGWFDLDQTRQLLGTRTLPDSPVVFIRQARKHELANKNEPGAQVSNIASVKYSMEITAFKPGAKIRFGDSSIVLHSKGELRIEGTATRAVIWSDNLRARELTVRDGETELDATNVRASFALRTRLDLSGSEPRGEVLGIAFNIKQATVKKLVVVVPGRSKTVLRDGWVTNATLTINPPDKMNGRPTTEVLFDGHYEGGIKGVDFSIKRKDGKAGFNVKLEGSYKGQVTVNNDGLALSGEGKVSGSLRGLHGTVKYKSAAGEQMIALRSEKRYNFSANGSIKMGPSMMELATPFTKSKEKARFSLYVDDEKAGVAELKALAKRNNIDVRGLRFRLDVHGSGLSIKGGVLEVRDFVATVGAKADSVTTSVPNPLKRTFAQFETVTNLVKAQFVLPEGKIKPIHLVRDLSAIGKIQSGHVHVEFNLVPGSFLSPKLQVPPGSKRPTMQLKASVVAGDVKNLVISFKPTLNPNGYTIMAGFEDLALVPDPKNPGQLKVAVDLTGFGELWPWSESDTNEEVTRSLARFFPNGIIPSDINKLMAGISEMLSVKNILQPLVTTRRQGDWAANSDLRASYTLLHGKTLRGVTLGHGKKSITLGPGGPHRDHLVITDASMASDELKAWLKRAFPGKIPTDVGAFKTALNNGVRPLRGERLDLKIGKGKTADVRLVVDEKAKQVRSLRFPYGGFAVALRPDPANRGQMRIIVTGSVVPGTSVMGELGDMYLRWQAKKRLREKFGADIPSDPKKFEALLQARFGAKPHDARFVAGSPTELWVENGTLSGRTTQTVSQYKGAHLLHYTRNCTFADLLRANPDLDKKLAPLLGKEVTSVRAYVKAHAKYNSVDDLFAKSTVLRTVDLAQFNSKQAIGMKIDTVVVPSVLRFGQGNRVELNKVDSFTIHDGKMVIKATAHRLVLGGKAGMFLDGGPGKVTIEIGLTAARTKGRQPVDYIITSEAIAINRLAVRAAGNRLRFNGGRMEDLVFRGKGWLTERGGKTVIDAGHVRISAKTQGSVTGFMPVKGNAPGAAVKIDNWLFNGSFSVEQGRPLRPESFRKTLAQLRTAVVHHKAQKFTVVKGEKVPNLLGEVLVGPDWAWYDTTKPKAHVRQAFLKKLERLQQNLGKFFPGKPKEVVALVNKLFDSLLPTEIRLKGKVGQLHATGNRFTVGDRRFSVTGSDIKLDVNGRVLTKDELVVLWTGIKALKGRIKAQREARVTVDEAWRSTSGSAKMLDLAVAPKLRELLALPNQAALKRLLADPATSRALFVAIARETVVFEDADREFISKNILHRVVPWVAEIDFTTRTGLRFEGSADLQMNIAHGSSSVGTEVKSGKRVGGMEVLEFGKGTLKVHSHLLRLRGLQGDLEFDTEPPKDKRYAVTLSTKVIGGTVDLINKGTVALTDGELKINLVNFDFKQGNPDIKGNIELTVKVAGKNLGNVPGERKVATHGKVSTTVHVKVAEFVVHRHPTKKGYLEVKLVNIDSSLKLNMHDVKLQLQRLIEMLRAAGRTEKEAPGERKAG